MILCASQEFFLFPSLDEGHPQVVGQAIACGLPVIMMKTIMPDYVINDYNGYLVEKDQDIEHKIKILLNDKELYNKMSKNGILNSKEV